MYCPVCKAEYRPGFRRCASCDVELVASLDDETEIQYGEFDAAAAESLHVELWRGDDIVLFNELQESLQETRTEFRVEGGEGNWRKPFLLGLSANPTGHLAVFVRSSELPAAREALASALKRTPRKRLLFDAESQSAGELLPENALICPLCESLPEEGSQCSICGIPLVNGAEFNASELSEHLWQGEHPGVFEEILQGLRLEQIPHYTPQRVMARRLHKPCCNSRLCVLVLTADARRAYCVVEAAFAHWRVDEDNDLGIRGSVRRAVEEETDDNSEWIPGERGALLWDGPVREIARSVRDCLRENDIISRLEKDSRKGFLVYVRVRDIERAKAIVLELLHATPPD